MKIKLSLKLKKQLLKLLTLKISKRCFYEYCKMLEPDYYSHTKPYLVRLCQLLDDSYNGKILDVAGNPRSIQIADIPKSLKVKEITKTLFHFCQWVCGDLVGDENDV